MICYIVSSGLACRRSCLPAPCDVYLIYYREDHLGLGQSITALILCHCSRCHCCRGICGGAAAAAVQGRGRGRPSERAKGIRRGGKRSDSSFIDRKAARQKVRRNREKSNIMIAGKYSPIYGDFKR